MREQAGHSYIGIKQHGVEPTEHGDGWVILWRPGDRNEWEIWRGQEGGVLQTFVPHRDGDGQCR